MNKRICQDYSESELVDLALKDSQFFYCLMIRYEEKLERYIGRFGGISAEDGEDIVAESFVNAYKNLNQFDNSLSFNNWIYRIAHNRAINYIKKYKINFRINIDEDDDDFVSWLVSDTDIEREAIRKNSEETVLAIFEKMKPEYKEVLLLKFFEDKDYVEISDILQKPMGTVATLISRAKLQFKKYYERQN